MERKQGILALLNTAEEPLSGSILAANFGVTRQIIVKDIALLKAQGHCILSTPKGYILHRQEALGVTRTLTVCHGVDDIEAELALIVDLGGRALTTQVNHAAYGELTEELNVCSGRDIRDFLKRISDHNCAPLLALTGGIHKHSIWAPKEEILDEIAQELAKKGYLISE